MAYDGWFGPQTFRLGLSQLFTPGMKITIDLAVRVSKHFTPFLAVWTSLDTM